MSEGTTSAAAEQRRGALTPETDKGTPNASIRVGDVDLMAVVAQYQGPLLRYVGRMLGADGDQREDVVQETFIRLHRQVSTQGWSSIRHLATWLFHVAHNLTLDVLRQRVRRQDAGQLSADPAILDEEHAASEVGALGEIIRQEARQVVLRELAQLQDEYRQVLLLKIVQDMSLRQVAEVIGVSLATVNSRLNQGLSLLAHRLRKAGVA